MTVPHRTTPYLNSAFQTRAANANSESIAIRTTYGTSHHARRHLLSLWQNDVDAPVRASSFDTSNPPLRARTDIGRASADESYLSVGHLALRCASWCVLRTRFHVRPTSLIALAQGQSLKLE